MKFITKINILKEMIIYISFLCSVIMVMHSICNFFDYDSKTFSYLGGTSLLMWILMWWVSYTLELCVYQKMFIYYIIGCNIIAFIDSTVGIPIGDLPYTLIYCIAFGTAVILYGVLRYKETNR